jgi:hypothetical protein
MTEIHKPEDLKTALIAAIMNAGGSIEVTFEQLGEASITEKTGDVAIFVERTATGVRYLLGPDGFSATLRGVDAIIDRITGRDGQEGATP